jgi:peptidase E
MVCSKTQYASEWFIGGEEPGASDYRGLGLIDFEIYPHYEDALYPRINQLWSIGNGKLYLLKNGEVISVVNNKVEIIGETRVVER